MRLSFKYPQYRLMFALVCCFALLAACGPQATPTPTAAPTEVQEEEAAETEAAEAEDAADEAEDADAEAAVDEAGDAEATEAAAEDETEAAEEDADATEAAADAGEEAAGDSSDAASTGLTATVNVSSTRMRESPSVAASVVAELTRDTQVDVLGRSQDNGYLFIRTEDGQEGWVAKQTMALSNPVAEIEVVSP